MSMLFFFKPFIVIDTARPEVYVVEEETPRKKKRRKVYNVKKEGRKAVAKELDTDKQARWLIQRKAAEQRRAQRIDKQKHDIAHILAVLDYLDHEEGYEL